MSNKIFKENDKIEKYEDIIKKLQHGDYDDMDWFNMDSKIENLLKSLKNKNDDNTEVKEDNSDVIKYIAYFFSKRFKEIKKLKNNVDITFDDINIVLNSVLVDMLEKGSKKSTSREDLIKKEYLISSGTKNQVDKALKYFEIFNVITKSKKLQKTYFDLNLDGWFKNCKYELRDEDFLKDLVPIITSFIKSGNVRINNIENLFLILSELIEFAIRPSIYHNSSIEIEDIILELIEDNKNIENKEDIESINIIIDGKMISILPIKIIYKAFDKCLICKNIDNDEELELELYEIEVNEFDNDDESYDINIESNFSINNNILDNKTTTKKEKIEVFLEIDSQVIDYYKIKPLSNTTLFFTEEDKKEFLLNYEVLNGNPSKFFIRAVESEEMIISTIMHTLDHVKILHPKDLNDKVAKKLKSFLEKSDYNFEIFGTPCRSFSMSGQAEKSITPNNKADNKKEEDDLESDKNIKNPKKQDLFKKSTPLDLF